MRMGSRTVALWACTVAIALTCACAKKGVKKLSGDARTSSDRAPEPGIHGSHFVSTPTLRAVYFEFDRHYLRKEAREILKQNAEVIMKNPGWKVLTEGNCDDRGTTEYNLALGQERAKAVREFYLLLGIPGGRVATISYGEEKPVCSESTEDCWARNRRAENKIKSAFHGGMADFRL